MSARQPSADGKTRLPQRFWRRAGAVLLSGICETLFGNWSNLDLTGESELSAQSSSLALLEFWGTSAPSLTATDRHRKKSR